MNQSAWKLAAAVILLAITVLSLMPAEPKEGVSVIDKFQHLIAYGALAFSLLRGFSSQAVWRVVVGAVLFGVAIEFAQQWLTETRQLDPLDMVANSLGVMLAVGFSALFGLGRESNREPDHSI